MSQDYSINEGIRKLRLSKNYSQKKVADMLGIKSSTYSQMERRGTIPATKIKALSRILGVDYNILLDGKPDPERKIAVTDVEELSDILIKKLEANYRNRYCFLENISDTELSFLRIIFCLNKKQRHLVYEYANKILKKETL